MTERERERERDKKEDIHLIGAEIANGVDVAPSLPTPSLIALFIYLLHPLYPPGERPPPPRHVILQSKARKSALLTLSLPSSFRGHFDSTHEISVMRSEGRREREIPLVSASAVPSFLPSFFPSVQRGVGGHLRSGAASDRRAATRD